MRRACHGAVLSHGSLVACVQPCDRFCETENPVAFSTVTKALRQGFWLHSWLQDQAQWTKCLKKNKQNKVKEKAFILMEMLTV